MSDIFGLTVNDLKIMKCNNGWVVQIPAHILGLGPMKDFIKEAKALNRDENDLSAIMERSKIEEPDANPKFPWVKEIYVFQSFHEVIEFLKSMDR